MRFWFAPVVIFGALLTACAGPPPLRSNEHVVVPADGVLPPPTRQDSSIQLRTYVLGPADRLSVEVLGIAELSRAVLIDASGRISLPVVGDIIAAGKTPAELSAEITRSLAAHHVRDPQVNVNVVEAVSQVVAVDGAVDEPGLYPIVGNMTLMRAIARAKGATEFATLRHVVLFRTVEGQPMAILYDLRAIRSGVYPDPQIYANDVVVVGESQARRLFRDLVQGAGLITTPIVALLQRN
jgi:polysaccharide export outer membrane protein